MRVRLNRSPSSRQQDPPARPRLRVVPDVAPPPSTPAGDEFSDERRMREEGGPHDTATYHCGCGYIFDAQVSTSVACPHCGAGQAW